LKFISLFFLLAIILIADVKANSHVSHVYRYKSTIDTIIKLDSIKDKKLIKGKKSKANPSSKNSVNKNDTTKKNANGLQSEVKSHAEDSTIVDQVHEITYLYGQARVTYEDFELDADYIRLDKQKKSSFVCQGKYRSCDKALRREAHLKTRKGKTTFIRLLTL
jgi:hypothetical protein